jgi:hypothetical protein
VQPPRDGHVRAQEHGYVAMRMRRLPTRR